MMLDLLYLAGLFGLCALAVMLTAGAVLCVKIIRDIWNG